MLASEGFVGVCQIRIVLGILCGVAVAAANCRATTPQFFNTSPEVTIVDLNAGQTSFAVVGSARDAQPAHIVDFFAFGLQPFMTLDRMPGNPGSFRLHAENLTGLNYGGYFVDVVAIDNAPQPSVSSYSFAIGIVPEPVAASTFLLMPAFLSRRR